MTTCTLCGKKQSETRMHRTYSTFSKTVHWYCKNMASCDKRRGVVVSEKAKAHA